MSDIPFYDRYAKRACAVCGSVDSKLLFRQTFSEMSSGSLLQGYDVVVCQVCGYGFADHLPDQADFDAHYRDMSKYEYQDQGGQETEFDLERFRAIVDTVIPFIPNPRARVLDVGCATGRLLALFKEKGYRNVIGLDPSPVCAQSAQKLYGIRVVTGTVSEIIRVLAHETLFDCVILSGVLEHICDVESAMTRMRGLVADDGMLFIEVPDATDFASWHDAPFQEFSTEHINFFSERSLENLMRRYGFVQARSQQLPRNQTATTIMPVVTALYRKQFVTQSALGYDHETERGLRNYVSKSQKAEDRIQQTIDVLVASAKPIIVWGVGTHTLHLLATSRLAHVPISAFVDSNPRYQGNLLHGIPIIAPANLNGKTEPILISSRVFQSEIVHQIHDILKLENKILTLYEA